MATWAPSLFLRRGAEVDFLIQNSGSRHGPQRLKAVLGNELRFSVVVR
jgi:hypothetical protein